MPRRKKWQEAALKVGVGNEAGKQYTCGSGVREAFAVVAGVSPWAGAFYVFEGLMNG